MSDILRAAARKKAGKIICPAAYKSKYYLSIKTDLKDLFREIKSLDLKELTEKSRAEILMDSSALDMLLEFFLGLNKSVSNTSYLKKTLAFVSKKTDSFNKRNVQNSLFDADSISGIPVKKLNKIFNNTVRHV